MFQRIGAAAIKKDLTNTIRLCEALGNPQRKFRIIHIAGTNGKGSTSHMLASVLQSAGYKTGLYTSPHLKAFTERIRVDGRALDEGYVVNIINQLRDVIDEVRPSFFEMTVAMAFDYFALQEVDVAVIETGLGGRLDSTNVVDPLLSVITNIGMDHADILGDTLEKIASEKAGIIKPNTPVVVSERQPDVAHVFEAYARRCAAPLRFASDRYAAIQYKDDFVVTYLPSGRSFRIALPLRGNYQARNLAGVFAAIDELRLAGFRLSDEQVVSGLERTVEQTGLKGRWQVLGHRPFTVCDTAHNAEGIACVAEQLTTITYGRLFVVLGMTKEKEIDKMLKLLPAAATYVFCQAKVPRALDAGVLAARAAAIGIQGTVIVDVNEAIAWAREKAGENDAIFIGGSSFVVAEIEEL